MESSISKPSLINKTGENKNSYEYVNTLNIDLFSWYLHAVGGHSMFITWSPNLLIKSSNPKEISFYKHMKDINFSSKYIPNFYGVVTKTSENYQAITHYMNQLEFFFKMYLCKKQFPNHIINIENDSEFNSLYNTMLNLEEVPDTDIKLHKSFLQLEKDLNTLDFKKLIWVCFWFVKWKDNFLWNDYIIIEQSTYGMLNPAILDIKIGSEMLFKKEKKRNKKFNGAFSEIGCRIMGIQKDYLIKNRYETRNYSMEEFKNEIRSFFCDRENKVNCDLIKHVIKEVKQWQDEIETQYSLIKFPSLLFAFDFNNTSPCVKTSIRWIDFSYFENKETNGDLVNEIKEDFIKSVGNFVELLEEYWNIDKD